jgi:hypothetical protein
MRATENDEDTFADVARVEAFESLPRDVQEAIVQGELRVVDELLEYNYGLPASRRER